MGVPIIIPAQRQPVLAGAFFERAWFRFFELLAKALGGATFLTGTATLDFPNTIAQSSSDLDIAVPNAKVGAAVVVGAPGVTADSTFTGHVQLAGLVTVRFNNYAAFAIDPGPGDYTVWVIQ